MSWTDERVELLKKLWADGLSASQIANELGGVTRNAVIGKVHRLNLSGRAKSAGGSPRPRKPRAPSAPRSRHVSIGNTALKTQPRSQPIARRSTIADPDVVVPISLRATILTLTETTCKWPHGDPGTENFNFCGHRSRDGSPYCNYHSGVAYQPIADRRRRNNSG